NKATVRYNNVSYGKGHGIQINGNYNNILNNTISKNKNNGINIKGYKNKIIENKIAENKGKGINIVGKNLEISYNIIYKNSKNGISGESNNGIIKGNLVYENSNKQKCSAIYFKGNNNNFQYNIIQNNGFRGLYIKGNKNTLKRTPIFKNKNTQLIIEGNLNNIVYSIVESGKKSGIALYGTSNKLSNLQIINNKGKGILIKGDKNQLDKIQIFNNTLGFHVTGNKNILEQSIILSNKKYGIYQLKGTNNHYNYNYIVNNKAKANLYRVKGSVNADYNWWGINNLKTVKNLKVKKYVIAILNAPNILKVKNKYTISVKFQSNDHKKLKKTIPNLIVYFGFEGGKLNPKYVFVKKNIAKVKIKPLKHKAINLVAKVDNQLLYKQYVNYNGKLYEYNLYVNIIMEQIRRYNEWVRKQNAKIKQQGQFALGTKMVFDSMSSNHIYSRSAMGRDLAKSTSILDKAVKINKPIIYGPGVGYAPPNLNFISGMKARNMPDGSFTKLFYDIAIKYNIKDQMTYYGLYVVGKLTDAYNYSQGDVGKFFEYIFINIYGYSNLDNYGWAGQAGKVILEFTLGIDEKGNMSMEDLTLNLVSIAFGMGVGGLAIKGMKNLTNAILRRIPAKYRAAAAKTIKNFAKTVEKYTGISLQNIDPLTVRKSIVDVAKVFTGDFSPILKSIPVPSKLKPANQLLKQFEKFTKDNKKIAKLVQGDFKEALNILNSNIKNMATLVNDPKVKAFLNGLSSTSAYKADLLTLTKSISEGPAKIKEAQEAIKKGSKNAEIYAKKLIEKYTKDMKALEKLLKLHGLK
ncbi:right-handed parallel beta-helix repeat-containing protein, partial [Methanobrevibacter sp.]|uniref:right-handed parallel beta-helix repeat-containing protein n=1 Tax=Methanobrevibacter sp. TaxID=66852 RepID=UPI002631EAEF